MMMLEDGSSGRDTVSVLNVIERLSEGMKRLEEEMLKEDIHTPVREALYHTAVMSMLPTPETIAKAKKNETLDKIISKKYDVNYPGIIEGGRKKL